MSLIYLDNNATTRVDPLVREEMAPFFDDLYGNPSSPHEFGGRVERHLSIARNRVADLLGCSPKEITFTGGGTEADNLALRGILAAKPDKRHIVTTRVEHSAILMPCQELEKQGYEVTYLGVDGEGKLDPAELETAIREETALVSTLWANNETGVVFPIEEISEICRGKKTLLHVDAVQAVGKIPIDLRKTRIDLLSLSGHKIHAPKGVGALYVRTGVRVRPILWGGHQERGKRPGTEPVAFIAGLGKAAQLAGERLASEPTQLGRMRDRLQEGLVETIPNLRLNGTENSRSPNTLNVCFCGVEGEALLLLLDQHGVAVSSGSACLADQLEPSHVLLAMGVGQEDAMGAVRFGFSRYNTMEEVDRVLEILPRLNEKLLELSEPVAPGP